jgi:predicted dehydrogenase
MAKSRKNSLFGADKRIKLGIWGLGRGASFFKACHGLGFDIVAGCDFDETLRNRFVQANPGEMVTDDAGRFLDADMDAVLLATFCHAHAADALACLKAGKHVLSEVTAFHTMAEGVELVEAVKRSGLVYNLAENYPFQKDNLYLATKWREGMFGELMYAEWEYLHEIRELSYTYLHGTPVQPGWTVHAWRSWINSHYYCTHSLGPVMHITGLRPVRVVSLPAGQRLSGYLGASPMDSLGAIAPSLITFSNGGIMRNLMGATTGDGHSQRIWGTKASAERNSGGLYLRVGGFGQAPPVRVDPRWPELANRADAMGHGGGDFWVLYYFAREILTGQKAFFDVYTAADCTATGILALRSAMENGRAYDVPDFRNKTERGAWRKDRWKQAPYDVKNGVFPPGHDQKITAEFTSVMKDLIGDATLCRAALDLASFADDIAEPAKAIEMIEKFLARRDAMGQTFTRARRILRAYPSSDGAAVLGEMIDLAEPRKAAAGSFVGKLRKTLTGLKRRRLKASGVVGH